MTIELKQLIEALLFSAERPLFRDTNHLAYWGAKYLGVPFSDFLNKEWLTPPNVKPDAYHTEVL